MSKIKSSDTEPEMDVRRALHSRGLRYRLHDRMLPGKPDLVFPSRRVVLFVNGCYWHSHDCRWGTVVSKTNTEFWQAKRVATVRRDRNQRAQLEDLGWRVLTVWECELRTRHEIIDDIVASLNRPKEVASAFVQSLDLPASPAGARSRNITAAPDKISQG